MSDRQLLIDQVEAVINNMTDEELNEDGEPYSAYDYIAEALDIEYIIGSGGDFKGARILVCFGGPNVWVDTQYDVVDGHWWGDSYSKSFSDELGLHEACEELWESMR